MKQHLVFGNMMIFSETVNGPFNGVHKNKSLKIKTPFKKLDKNRCLVMGFPNFINNETGKAFEFSVEINRAPEPGDDSGELKYLEVFYDISDQFTPDGKIGQITLFGFIFEGLENDNVQIGRPKVLNKYKQ